MWIPRRINTFEQPSGVGGNNNLFLFSLSQLLEAGFVEMWKKKWWPTSQTCSDTGPTSSALSLELPAVSGIFVLVGIMWLLLSWGWNIGYLTRERTTN